MVGLGGLEPPASPLSVAALIVTTACDDLLWRWFSMPAAAVAALPDYYRLLWFLTQSGHKMLSYN